MPVLYVSNGLKIKKSWIFNKISVQEIATGRRVTATPGQAARCAFLLQVQANLELTAKEREQVCDYIFARFGMTVLHPTSVPATMFMEGDGGRLLGAAVVAAKMETQDERGNGVRVRVE